MIRIALILSLLFAVNISASINKDFNDFADLTEPELRNLLFNNSEESHDTDLDLCDLDIIEIEEEVELGFDTKQYLPKDFNPLKGMHDLNWSKIQLVVMEEEVEIDFDTKQYLPEGFNPLKGKHDVNWSTIELVELDEEVVLPFNAKKYLPENFCPYKGMC